MRKGYWIILVFAAWCIISAVWYMFSVKGLPENTGLIKPSTTTVAIAEIIVMVTVAFLMGFAMAWMMRTEPLEQATDEVRNSKYEIRELEAQLAYHKEASDNADLKIQQAEERAANARLSSDQLNSQISDLTLSEQQLKRKNTDLEAKLLLMEGEVNSSKFRVRMLEGEVEEKAKGISKLAQELAEAETLPKVEHREWSDHPFVRPMEPETETHDDLTEIKGIGPAFQRKLNSLDIYTFRQISELDGEAVSRLAEVIEVFPDRIHRDNWIGQATRLYLKKIGKEV